MEGLPQNHLTPPGKEPHPRFTTVVIGASAGGINAFATIVSALPATLPQAVVLVLHQSASGAPGWVEYLRRQSRLPVVEAEDKLPLICGQVHCAPPGYHLLVEADGTLALSVDEKVNFSRPSIDLLFSSAAEAFGPALIGVILTGANSDGARGLADVAAGGGLAVVQSPDSAEWPVMPQQALLAVPRALVMDLKGIAAKLVELSRP